MVEVGSSTAGVVVSKFIDAASTSTAVSVAVVVAVVVAVAIAVGVVTAIGVDAGDVENVKEVRAGNVRERRVGGVPG